VNARTAVSGVLRVIDQITEEFFAGPGESSKVRLALEIVASQ